MRNKSIFGIGIIAVAALLSSIAQNTQIYAAEESAALEARMLEATDIPVIMYHNFEPGITGEGTNVEPRQFETQIKYLAENGYHGVNSKDLTAYFDNGKPLPEKPIMITVDDGYISNYSQAYPILKKYNMKATIFVIVSSVGKKPGAFAHFSWKQAKEMYDSGLIDIQNHTYDTHYLVKPGKKTVSALVAKVNKKGKTESENQHFNRIYRDITTGSKTIEKYVGNKVVSFAFPYGQYDNQTIYISCVKSGMRFCFTTKGGVSDFTGNNDFDVKRFAVHNEDTGESIENKIQEALANK